MAIPPASTKVSLIGESDNGIEEFVTSFWCINTALETPADANTFCEAVSDLFVGNLMGPAQAFYSTDTAFTEVRAYSYATSQVAEVIGSSPIPGGAGNSSSLACLQQSVVITLLSDFAGKRHRGRMYFPADAATLTSGHYFAAAAKLALSEGAAAFFDAVNDLVPEPGSVGIVSIAGTASVAVTAVRVDSKPDIQRRRANKQPSGPTSTTPLT